MNTTETVTVKPKPFRWLDRVINMFRRGQRRVTENQKAVILKRAFTVGGRTYYQFPDLNNQPYERALTAIDYYEELRAKTSKEFIVASCDAILQQINGSTGKVDLVKAGQLVTQLKQRTEWITTPDLLYKLAAVVFIDLERESPFQFDFGIASEKINHWKAHKEATAFFLQTPVIELVPFLMEVECDIRSYLKAVQKVQRLQLELISSGISVPGKENAGAKALLLQLEKQIELGDFAP